MLPSALPTLWGRLCSLFGLPSAPAIAEGPTGLDAHAPAWAPPGGAGPNPGHGDAACSAGELDGIERSRFTGQPPARPSGQSAAGPFSRVRGKEKLALEPALADPAMAVAESLRPAAVVARPDPERTVLEARRAALEDQLAVLAARRAEMAECLQGFEISQYRALGGVLGECLRLRHLCRRLEAERSGSAADQAAEAEAGEEFADYERAQAEVDASPPLSDTKQQELKRLYRAAAMHCHPDRVEEARREAAHALFIRTQQAYRRGDLEALRDLQAEITQGLGGRGPGDGSAGIEDLERLLARLQIQAADLILAIQTLQLDSGYQRALRPEEWEPYFDTARRQFEAEIVSLKRRIRALGGEA